MCRKEWNTTLSGKPSFWWMYRQLGMEWDLPQAFVVFPSAGVLPGQGGGGFIGQETGQGLDQGLHFLNRPWAPFAVLLPIFQQTLPAECGGVLFQWDDGQFRAGDGFTRLAPTQVPGCSPEGGGKRFKTCVQSPVVHVPPGGQMQEMGDVDFELLQEGEVSDDPWRGEITDKIRVFSRDQQAVFHVIALHPGSQLGGNQLPIFRFIFLHDGGIHQLCGSLDFFLRELGTGNRFDDLQEMRLLFRWQGIEELFQNRAFGFVCPGDFLVHGGVSGPGGLRPPQQHSGEPGARLPGGCRSPGKTANSRSRQPCGSRTRGSDSGLENIGELAGKMEERTPAKQVHRVFDLTFSYTSSHSV